MKSSASNSGVSQRARLGFKETAIISLESNYKGKLET